ncbi:hypothetical protein FA95DRAFT_1566390 [Auriscalpium vulgare]|uniref:Uncharacterized protein n=1 Tax=Auriscalpium vulgare TaxID=40419 RepID=A0ACB8R919_9AGAM|nr:hypothetical protein FA95DRAFT_1566390 [Auriscalpium vulgare]
MESLNDAGYKRWVGTEWWTESYEELWSGAEAAAEHAEHVEAAGDEAKRASAPKESVVYLTADSPDELTELKEGETYIIGGICDHNRYKVLCLDKAQASGIRAAQLPIGRYLAHLPTRKVLTVNQVFEILVHWTETRDWEQALYTVIPKRKFQGAVGATEGNDVEEDDGDDGVDHADAAEADV